MHADPRVAVEISRWVRAHPVVADICVAAATFALSLLLLVAATPPAPGPRGAGILGIAWLLAVACLPLLARRRRPIEVVAVVVAIESTYLALLPALAPLPFASSVALCSMAVRVPRRRAWAVGAGVAALVTACAMSGRAGPPMTAANLAVIAWTGLAIAIGDTIRTRRSYLEALRERASRAERTREEEARRRVAEERVRIARELHDVVTHHLTLVNAQVGVAHHLLLTDPEVAHRALENVRDTSRAALDELRGTVRVLRTADEPDPDRHPMPGLEDLPELVAAFGGIGLQVHVGCQGWRRRLPPTVDLAAYRIIQEALTNTGRHSVAGTAVVLLDFAADRLILTVEDHAVDGRSGVPGSTGGHGILGMRERAEAAGGSLVAGPRPGGGFRVHSEIPLPPMRPPEPARRSR